LKRDWPLEQSDTEAPADAKSRESRANTRLILDIIRDQSLGRSYNGHLFGIIIIYLDWTILF
jgi:hypothetical protein